MKRATKSVLWYVAVIFALVTISGSAQSQTSTNERSQPHSTAGGSADSAPATSGTSQPAAGRSPGGMMEHMGSGQRPFYASLLDLPTLTPEARTLISAEAELRIGQGSRLIADGQAQLHQAIVSVDAVSMQQAALGLREGIRLVESGTAALRAVTSDTPPREFATAWFRGQMGLPSLNMGTPTLNDGPWGLSWYHLTTMAFLVTAVLFTSFIHYTRMRRMGVLVARLVPSAPTGVVPSPADPTLPERPAPEVFPTGLPPAESTLGTMPNIWKGPLRLAAIFPETPTVKTFRLMVADGGVIPFTFQPGQFLTLTVEIERRRVSRSYTIASSPTRRDYVEVTIRRDEQGVESRHLHDEIRVGDLIEVAGPAGAFTFAGRESDSIVLIAGGVGITPMMSVLRYLTDRAWPGEIYLLYGVRSTLDFIFRDELEYLQRRHRNLHVAATMTRAEGTSWMGPEGPISREFIARSVPNVTRQRVHLCGPPAMMEAVQVALAELGVPREQIRTEAFGPARGRAPVVAPASEPAVPATAASVDVPEAAAPSVTAVIPSAVARVEFARSQKAAPLAPDQTVLEAAETVGVAIDYSCRVGICGTCMVPLRSGTVTMDVEDGLPAEDKARGMILACQAKSVDNLIVEA